MKSTVNDLDTSAIPYIANQPMDPQLWGSYGNFCPISLFGLDEYLEEDTKNIMCSLLRMVAFIRQHKLENRTAEDISQILEFGFIAWEFLSFIYESGWDKLIANKDNKTFRQYISSQFNIKPTKNIIKNNSSKDKQIPLPIPLRSSKVFWPNLNFSRKTYLLTQLLNPMNGYMYKYLKIILRRLSRLKKLSQNYLLTRL